VGGDAPALTKAADALGDADVNILGFSVHGPEGVAYLVPEDAERAVDALGTAGVGQAETVPVVTATLPNRPGELGRAARELDEAGVTLEASFPTVSPARPDVRVAAVCREPERAKKTLEGLEPDEPDPAT
jgi:hypothetical protein